MQYIIIYLYVFNHTHTIHVWYIYLTWKPWKINHSSSINIPYMDGMGIYVLPSLKPTLRPWIMGYKWMIHLLSGLAYLFRCKKRLPQTCDRPFPAGLRCELYGCRVPSPIRFPGDSKLGKLAGFPLSNSGNPNLPKELRVLILGIIHYREYVVATDICVICSWYM